MPILVTCKFDEDPIKIEGIIDRTSSNMGFFGTQGQVIKVDSLFWPNFQFIWGFMPVLVISKFDEEPIKNEGTMPWTTFAPL